MELVVGASFAGADVARAEMAHCKLYERVIASFGRLNVPMAPTTQVQPFPVETECPADDAGVPQQDYLARCAPAR